MYEFPPGEGKTVDVYASLFAAVHPAMPNLLLRKSIRWDLRVLCASLMKYILFCPIFIPRRVREKLVASTCSALYGLDFRIQVL